MDEAGHKQGERDDVNEEIRHIKIKTNNPYSQTLNGTEEKKRKPNKNVLRQKNRGFWLKLTVDVCKNVSLPVSKHDYKVLSHLCRTHTQKAYGKTFQQTCTVTHTLSHTHTHTQRHFINHMHNLRLPYQHHHMSHALLSHLCLSLHRPLLESSGHHCVCVCVCVCVCPLAHFLLPSLYFSHGISTNPASR